MVTQDPDKRGYYLVGFKKFYNKIEALQYATQYNFNVRWVFNDNVYGAIDWTKPIECSLNDLYKERAQRLRDTYSHIVLHYSGGQDSNNILHSFLDNNIHLDQIIVQVPKPMLSKIKQNDMSWENYWAEFEYQAMPYLKKFEHELRNTKIVVQDMSISTLDTFKHDNWMEIVNPNASYNLGVISRAMAQYSDSTTLSILDKGKSSCQLLGIDKPLVYYDGKDYYCVFADQSAYHMQAKDRTIKDISESSVTEFFYWTPDMPQIVVKQAQVIKAACETNKNIQNLFNKTLKQEVGLFREVMQSLIYDELHTPMFQTGKPGHNASRMLHTWFYEGTDSKLAHNYEYAVNSLYNTIDRSFFINNEAATGFSSIHSRFYKL